MDYGLMDCRKKVLKKNIKKNLEIWLFFQIAVYLYI